MLAKSRAEKRHTREPKLTDGEVFMPDDKSFGESTWGMISLDEVNPVEDIKYRPKVTSSFSTFPDLQ